MIDIETLGTQPDAAIVSVGLCWFYPETSSVLQPKSALLAPHEGASIDFSTVRWWMDQSEPARAKIRDPFRLLETDALSWLESHVASDDIVWAMPPSFDLVILESAYRRAGRKAPWHYANTRCVRTVCELAGIKKEDRVKATVAHDAGADAEAQAKTVVLAYQRLGLCSNAT